MMPNSPEALVAHRSSPRLFAICWASSQSCLLRPIVNLDVGVAFCGEAPEAQPWIVAHDWVLQLVVQESRQIDEGHRLGF